MKLRIFGRRPSPADLAPVPVPPPAAPKPAPTQAEFTLPPVPTAAAVPAPLFQAGRYVVTYDRFGRYGDRRYGLPAPMTLTLVAESAADLAEQIRVDIEPFVGSADGIEVTIDMLVSGGKITAGAVSGTFTFARGGAR
jgi:hypothetical protein